MSGWSFVQSLTNSAGGPSFPWATSWGAPVGNGNAVIVFTGNSGVNVTGITDDKGNTYTALPDGNNGQDYSLQAFYCLNITNAPTEVIVEGSGQGLFTEVMAIEVSGLVEIDQSPAFVSNSSGSSTPAASATTTSNNEFIVGYTSTQDGGGITVTPGSGFTAVGSGTDFAIEYGGQTTAGAITADWNASGSGPWGAGIATFTTASGTTVTANASIASENLAAAERDIRSAIEFVATQQTQALPLWQEWLFSERSDLPLPFENAFLGSLMTTLKPSYGSATTLTITTSSLASDTNLLAGRQSNIANNTSDLAVDSFVGGAIAAPGSAPTAGTFIEVWLFGSWNNGTTYTAGASGSGDANLSLATTGVKQLMSRIALISQTDTTARAYDFGPCSVAQAFGGSMPDHYGVFIVQNLGVTLGATTLQYMPLQYTNS